ncbi:uncharacterized protein [Rutidosis leptorrhynchoides]|uniref:uncharacterized protein n=1 Tax=Rutidosis leptorrhynchoides TaxID=125765 RepID=UPI003A98D34F
MHRQSLGSPASKLHSHGVFFPGAGIIKDDIDTEFISENNKLSVSSSSNNTNDVERKSQKSVSVSVSSSTRLVHLIPFLTFLCFVILYLSSHDPSTTELAQFSGYTTLSSEKALIGSIEIDANIRRGFIEIEKSNVLAIRSMRNLKQQQDRSRFHRKLGQ